ncbi:MAG: Rrf2 family transcriptional regulator [Gammaproteobacteria bacterium]|nr:Rrf2 family transcriptional regulator [Gammaproteobacteria bacterium]
MKIPTKGRYAVAAMMDLALHDSIRPLTIAEIAEKQNISLSYLEQLFAVLRRANLVRGTRGPGGGYRLAQPAEAISIAQVIRTVDSGSRKKGDSEEYLPYILWDNLSQKIYDYLDSITIAECLQQPDMIPTDDKALSKQGEQSEKLCAA